MTGRIRKGCAVGDAVREGKSVRGRYENYLRLYEEQKKRKMAR